jgi:hypothetical protein
MFHKSCGHDLGHDPIGVVDALAALVSQRIGERGGEVGRIGGRKLVGGAWHWRTIAVTNERIKNKRAECSLGGGHIGLVNDI